MHLLYPVTYKTDDNTKKKTVKPRLDPITPLTVVIGPSLPTIALTSKAAMINRARTKPRLLPDIVAAELLQCAEPI